MCMIQVNMNPTPLEKVYMTVVAYLEGDCPCTCEDCLRFLRAIEEIRQEQEKVNARIPGSIPKPLFPTG